jgi:hypothetical protein
MREWGAICVLQTRKASWWFVRSTWGGKKAHEVSLSFFSSLSNFPPTPRPPPPLFLLRIWHMLWLAGGYHHVRTIYY